MKNQHLTLLLLFGICSLALTSAGVIDDSYDHDHNDHGFHLDDDDDSDEADENAAMQQCQMAFMMSCGQIVNELQASGDYDSPEAVRELGLRNVCKDVKKITTCSSRVVDSDSCARMPQMYKRIFQKSVSFLDYVCDDKLDDIEKHWECLLHNEVGEDVKSCTDFDPSELQHCNTRDAFRCVDDVYGNSPICKPGAADLVKGLLGKAVDIIPGCSDRKRVQRQLLNFFKK